LINFKKDILLMKI